MHNRPRQPYGVPEDPRKIESRQRKHHQLHQLTDAVLHNIAEKNHSPSALDHAALLLSKNPDVYTVWNFRREALADLLEGKEGRERAKDTATQELKVTEIALMENPKSYSAWHHRLWIVQKGLVPLDEELKQVSKFLKFDSRNFHAWKYRREIVKLAGTDIEDELVYSRQLIDENFSNYSAWHARTALLTEKFSTQQVVSLQELMAGSGPGHSKMRIPLDALDQEFDLTKQAFFTDPEDQSAYFYHRWLVRSLMDHASSDDQSPEPLDNQKEVLKRLKTEQASCMELLESEPDRSRCKWPLQSLAYVLRQQRSLGETIAQSELQDIYKELTSIDPYRAGYYKDALQS